MSIDSHIRRIITRIAKANEARFTDAAGKIDKKALGEFVLDELERDYPDILPVVEKEAPLWMIEETIREVYRKTHGLMKTEIKEMETEEEDSEPSLPSFEVIRKIKLSVPVGSGNHETKAMLDCALWEVDIVDEDYGTRADSMLQHQKFCRAVSRQMRLQGFETTDRVRKLYGVI